MRQHGGMKVLVLAMLTAVAGVGCSASDDAQSVTQAVTCDGTVAAAADAIEVDRQVQLLDDALVRCPSLESLLAAIGQHPGLIGFEPDQFVQLRCAAAPGPAVRDSTVCTTVIPPVVTTPQLPESVVFVGETLDGRQIRIVPTDQVDFVGAVPAVIQQTVDIAVESGCEGVIAQRDTWAYQTGDPSISDIASVYAQHAQRVADYIGCDVPPIEVGRAPATSAP